MVLRCMIWFKVDMAKYGISCHDVVLGEININGKWKK